MICCFFCWFKLVELTFFTENSYSAVDWICDQNSVDNIHVLAIAEQSCTAFRPSLFLMLFSRK